MFAVMFVGLIVCLAGWITIQICDVPNPRNLRWYNYLAVVLMVGGVVLFVVATGVLAWRYLP